MKDLRTWTSTIAVAFLVSAAGCGGSGDGGGRELSGASLSVGSKEFAEQEILGQMTVLLLENAGAEVEDKVGISGTRNVRKALEEGAIDMYWEYTGTGWAVHLGRPTSDAPSEPAELYLQVMESDRADNSVVWLEPAPLNNTYAVATAAGRDVELGVSNLSDYSMLANADPEAATVCGAREWLTRSDGLPGLESTYGFDIPNSALAEVDLALIYELVPSGEQCNFGEVFATDGRIISNNLVLLEDDLNFFLAYQASLTVRGDVYDKYGEAIEALFNPVAEELTNSVMQRLNARVDVNGEEPKTVAEDFLREQGFIP